MQKVEEGLFDYDDEVEAPTQHKCNLCDSQGVYRYAPYDFGNNWKEESRWRCWEHGKQYDNDPEWDYFGDI